MLYLKLKEKKFKNFVFSMFYSLTCIGMPDKKVMCPCTQLLQALTKMVINEVGNDKTKRSYKLT